MFAAHPPFQAPPAGGAAVSEIVIALGMTLAVLFPVAWFLMRERAGNRTVIGRVADWAAAKDGTPRWVALPSYLATATLLTAGFGVWWDVATHMQRGRDEGPLANPSHYPIFLAILGFFAAGLISAGLAKGELPERTFRITRSWRAPMGAMVITGAGLIALAGFPADDLWHRLFGQDVTEWGPTHIMMIGGAVTCALGLPLLHAEARQVGAPGTLGLRGRLRGAIALAICIVPFAFLMEFDLGVPQFPAATQFIISGFLCAWIFGAVRAWFGPGGALLAWGVYLVAHLFLMAATALLDDVLIARFLLFLPAAILVELVALVVPPRRAVAFGVVSGVLVGTVGMAAEWAWSHVFMPLPQPLPAHTLPLMLAVGTGAAVVDGQLGAWHVRQLGAVVVRDGAGSTWERHGAGLVGMGLFVALMAVFAPPTENPGLSGTVDLAEPCDGVRKCLTTVTVTMRPADAVDDAIWFYALAWQGHRNDETDPNPPLDPVAGVTGVLRVEMLPTGVPGQFRSAHPLPMYGNWKTLVRVHQAPTVHMALPVHAPDDPAITEPKGRQVLVRDGQTVPLITESEFLQREQKTEVPDWLWSTAYAAVGASWFALIAFYGWCYAAAAYGTNRRRSEIGARA
ncbi:hypothetical protein GCM10023148_46300 [Actinokineospora soli]